VNTSSRSSGISLTLLATVLVMAVGPSMGQVELVILAVLVAVALFGIARAAKSGQQVGRAERL
jgi:hypothetical protein